MSPNAVNTPAEDSVAINVEPYLNTRLPPDSSTVKFEVKSLGVLAAVPVVFWFNVGNVQFVNVPEEGVPNTPPFTTGAPAEPTFTAKAVATPVPKPEMPVATGSPVVFVSVPEAGVPKAGVTNVGLLNVPAVTEAPVNTAVPVTVGEDIVGELNVGEIM